MLRNRITTAQTTLMLKLREANKSQTDIAHIVGCSQAEVSRTLAEFADRRLTARDRARTRALEVLEATFDGVVSAAKKGKPEAGLEVLDSLGVVERKRERSEGAKVVVVVGMPGQAAGPDPLCLEGEVAQVNGSALIDNSREFCTD